MANIEDGTAKQAAIHKAIAENRRINPSHPQEQETLPEVSSFPTQDNAHWTWNEINNRCDSYLCAIAAGQNYEEALNFARFILWSGLDKLLLPFDGKSEVLKVDVSLMRWKANELQRKAQVLFRPGARDIGTETVLQGINRRLDLIAGHISRLH